MRDRVNHFYNSFENAEKFGSNELIELFVYFLTEELGHDSATAKQVMSCFSECDLAVPSSVAPYLSNGVKANPATFIKAKTGYRLQRYVKERIAARLGVGKVEVSTSTELRKLQSLMSDGDAKDFLVEVIDCFDVGANRAAIVMCWILTMDHMYEYVLKYKLNDFNAVLAKNTDKRVRVMVVKTKDDFTEMPENKFIEFCKSAKIIPNSVRKILDEKRDTRNSCAHPSGITVRKSKTIEFIEDLISNVFLKYPI